jgi:hypothetical protein
MAQKKLAELTDGELADRWGAAKARGDAADAGIEELKAEFERRKLDFAKGDTWKVFKDVQNQRRLDTAAIRQAQGAEWCKDFEKPQTRVSYKVQPA